MNAIPTKEINKAVRGERAALLRIVRKHVSGAALQAVEAAVKRHVKACQTHEGGSGRK